LNICISNWNISEWVWVWVWGSWYGVETFTSGTFEIVSASSPHVISQTAWTISLAAAKTFAIGTSSAGLLLAFFPSSAVTRRTMLS
jgi:hypothetical protein